MDSLKCAQGCELGGCELDWVRLLHEFIIENNQNLKMQTERPFQTVRFRYDSNYH